MLLNAVSVEPKMITKDQMLPFLTKACPSFLPVWEQIQAERGANEPLIYIELGMFAQHVVELQIAGRTAEFAGIFALVERFCTEGDEFVLNAVVVGLLEDIQTIAGNRNVDPTVYEPFLLPVSAGWWIGLNRFWSGENPTVVSGGTNPT